MKTRKLKIVKTVRALVALAVCIQLNGYVQLHLTKAHLHWANGLLVAHWHPQTSGTVSPGPGQTEIPVSGHSHSLCDIFDLLSPDQTNYLPGVIQTGDLPDLQVEITFTLPDEQQPIHTTLLTKSGRSPPAVSA